MSQPPSPLPALQLMSRMTGRTTDPQGDTTCPNIILQLGLVYYQRYFQLIFSVNDGRVTPDEEEYEEDEEEEEGENEVRTTIYLSKFPHLNQFM